MCLRTPLHDACYKEKIDVIVCLLQLGADYNLKNLDGKTPIELNAKNETIQSIFDGEYRKDELLEAARSGNEDQLKQLLTPFNINCHASDGRKSTPLHLASGYNRVKIVQHLLALGADVHAKDKGGLVALHNACSYGHYEVAKLLIEHDANPNTSDMWAFTPLHEAVQKNRSEVCSLLLAFKAQPLIANCYNKTAFDLAKEVSLELSSRLEYEYAGYCLLDAVKDNDYAKVKRILSINQTNEETVKAPQPDASLVLATQPDQAESVNKTKTRDLINFKHLVTLDAPIVRPCHLSPGIRIFLSKFLNLF